MTNQTNQLQSSSAQNPWSAPMHCIIWGLILRGFILEFFWLNHLLPIFGGVLLFWGCHALRERHTGFQTAERIVLAQLALALVSSLIAATPIGAREFASALIN